MSDGSIEVTGLEELKAKLDELCTKDSRRIIRDGLKVAGQQITGAMQAEGSSAPGEIGDALADPKSWKASIRTKTSASGEAGTLSVKPVGSLPEVHTARGKGRQPQGKKYHRSLQYLISLMEFGPKVGETALPKTQPMSNGWVNSRDRAMNAFVDTCKEVLGLD